MPSRGMMTVARLLKYIYAPAVAVIDRCGDEEVTITGAFIIIRFCANIKTANGAFFKGKAREIKEITFS